MRGCAGRGYEVDGFEKVGLDSICDSDSWFFDGIHRV